MNTCTRYKVLLVYILIWLGCDPAKCAVTQSQTTKNTSQTGRAAGNQPIELDIKSKKGDDKVEYKVEGKVHTYTPKGGFAFRAVKQGNDLIWSTDNSTEYSDKVEYDENNKTVTIYQLNNITEFVNENNAWKESENQPYEPILNVLKIQAYAKALSQVKAQGLELVIKKANELSAAADDLLNSSSTQVELKSIIVVNKFLDLKKECEKLNDSQKQLVMTKFDEAEGEFGLLKQAAVENLLAKKRQELEAHNLSRFNKIPNPPDSQVTTSSHSLVTAQEKEESAESESHDLRASVEALANKCQGDNHRVLKRVCQELAREIDEWNEGRNDFERVLHKFSQVLQEYDKLSVGDKAILKNEFDPVKQVHDSIAAIIKIKDFANRVSKVTDPNLQHIRAKAEELNKAVDSLIHSQANIEQNASAVTDKFNQLQSECLALDSDTRPKLEAELSNIESTCVLNNDASEIICTRASSIPCTSKSSQMPKRDLQEYVTCSPDGKREAAQAKSEESAFNSRSNLRQQAPLVKHTAKPQYLESNVDKTRQVVQESEAKEEKVSEAKSDEKEENKNVDYRMLVLGGICFVLVLVVVVLLVLKCFS